MQVACHVNSGGRNAEILLFLVQLVAGGSLCLLKEIGAVGQTVDLYHSLSGVGGSTDKRIGQCRVAGSSGIDVLLALCVVLEIELGLGAVALHKIHIIICAVKGGIKVLALGSVYLAELGAGHLDGVVLHHDAPCILELLCGIEG